MFLINHLGYEDPPIFKVKKFACKSLKGRGVKSGIRVIYAHIARSDEIHFIEIYTKSEKDIENRERIIEFFKKQ